MNKKNIVLIGTGQMAIDYAKTLQAQNCIFTVIGRGNESAKRFEEEIGIKPIVGGIEKYLKNNILENTQVIIATGTEVLMAILILVLKAGASKVLIEKPAAISIEELLHNETKLQPYLDKVYVAYNRRFYSSVIEAQKLIEKDGGLKSMHFEFTEWAHKIEPLQKALGVKENWFFTNCTHVIDLAFYFGGMPKEWNSYSTTGNLSWHNKTNFVGSGITEKKVLFSYISNWESAGRWSLELLTEKHRIYLKPLELLSIQNKGEIKITEYPLDDNLDKKFKPGLYLQVKAFLFENNNALESISEHIQNCKLIYLKILA